MGKFLYTIRWAGTVSSLAHVRKGPGSSRGQIEWSDLTISHYQIREYNKLYSERSK